MTIDAPRCDNCDKPIATQTDYYSLGKDEGGDLCWRLFNGGGRGGVCNQPSVDWCARTRAAEARAVTPETVIALFKALDSTRTDGSFAAAFHRHSEQLAYLRVDADDYERNPLGFLARFGDSYDSSADAIKHDLARLVMERAGIGDIK